MRYDFSEGEEKNEFKKNYQECVAAGLLTSLIVSGTANGETVSTQDKMDQYGWQGTIYLKVSDKVESFRMYVNGQRIDTSDIIRDEGISSVDISGQLLDLTADMAVESLKLIPEDAGSPEEKTHPSVRNALSKKRLFEIEAERYTEEKPGEKEHIEELREFINAAFQAAGVTEGKE